MKDLKNYLPFYIGCSVTDGQHIMKLLSVGVHGYVAANDKVQSQGVFERIKPILRPLSDMTDDDRKAIFKFVFGRDFPANGNINHFPSKKGKPNERWVLWSGVDRLGIEQKFTVWADCDLSHYDYNQHEMTRLLASMEFDLFELIDSGLAINKTLLKLNK